MESFTDLFADGHVPFMHHNHYLVVMPAALIDYGLEVGAGGV